MVFECNIDARGKAMRMKLGIRLMIGSILLATIVFFKIIPSTIGWVLVGCGFLGSAFTIFESRMGWCAVRAMGFKTKI